MHETERRLAGLGLHTVCVQARCPNISECFSRGTATFLILGDICTRSCAFCNVTSGKPRPPDPGEPDRVARAVTRLGLKHVVVTSVTRDDLPDGGAGTFARVITALRENDIAATIEVLVPDFMGNGPAIKTVVEAGPDIFGHNIETVRSLYSIKSKGSYDRSLKVLSYAKFCSNATFTKSALLLGMGESAEEVTTALRDLRRANCDYLSIGQYLQPGKRNMPVKQYLSPDRFECYKQMGLDMGFKHVESGEYVRSSYLAEQYR